MNRVHAIVITYQRPTELARALSAIAEQTLRVSGLVVVDNGGRNAVTPGLVDRFRGAGLAVDLITPNRNLGPAGGRAVGMEAALEMADDDDWLALFDDDDVLPASDTLEALMKFADVMRTSEARLGGIGLRGARFDWSRARTIPIPDRALERGPVRVDHLHGNFFPFYSVAAVRDVGTFRPELFFGFEELDYGLRMTDAGYSLFVDGELLRSYAPLLSDYAQRTRPSLALDEPRWERYYGLRNVLWILIHRGHALQAARVAFIRGLAKPIANLPLHPARALSHLSLAVRAIRDAWGNRLGAIAGVDPRDIA